jgi:2-polyprenyl-3-methyl-5-hydroxy-6-metoxy-1,4-benzoquinol methylase
MRRGWFIIPGVQTGDRTIEEQMTGVTPALAEASGKTVLDLGCAEGLVGREFALAAAKSVHGVDSIEDHLACARKQCRGLPMTFEHANLNEWIPPQLENGTIQRYDIVLSLGVAHKMMFPELGVRFSARACDDLCLIRVSAYEEARDGLIRSKHFRTNTCSVFEVMPEEGFELQTILPGPRDETVHYWRRKR